MKTTDFNDRAVNACLILLKNLGTENKLDLIAKLSQEIKQSVADKKMADKRDASRFYGAWQSEQTAEEMIEQIRQSRTSIRKVPDL